MNRKEREKLLRKQEILQAAKSVFAEKGFDAATMDEIALRADFSKGLIYGYFKNKEDLFASLMENEIDNLFRVVEENLHDLKHPLVTIERLIKQTFAYLDQNRAFVRIFTPERAGLTKERHPEIIGRVIPKFERLIRLTARCFEEGIRKGMLRKIDPELSAHILFSMIHASVTRWVIEGQAGSLKREAKMVASIILNGIKAPKT